MQRGRSPGPTVVRRVHDAARSEISAFDLEERVHEFHQGPARRFYSIYTGLDPDRKVARAVALKVLKEDEVPKDVLEKLRSKIEFFAEL